MKLYLKKETCCGCSACADICPGNAIDMIQDREGFCYPEVNESICVDCGKCEQVCPMSRQEAAECDHLYLGARAKDDSLRYSSSSGGIFGVLARYVIERQGIVYGAGYANHMKVVHMGASDLTQLELIKRTKYVQSDMGGVYCRIEKDLKDNKWVLFCGTPCQAQALILFLGREYERLIVTDLVCYGVPSPGIWSDYVSYLEHKNKGKMVDFHFRDKRNADSGQMRSYIINEKECVTSLSEDFFCKMYFRNRIIRPSCHSCQFCTIDRCSDFTIGDFWGIEHVRPDMDDGMGISMVAAHNDKAKRIWREIRQETRWFECRKKDLIQPRLEVPSAAAKDRWKFMLLYQILPFSVLVKVMKL